MRGRPKENFRCHVCGFDIPDGNYAPSSRTKGVFHDVKGREWRIQVSRMLSAGEDGARKAGFRLLPICEACMREILDFIKSRNPEI